jgi:uncharacterized integral membrane protein (TIGR00697 family)
MVEMMGLVMMWAVGVTSFTLLGSLYARRFLRPDLLIGLYVAFVLTAQVLATKMALFPLGIGTFTGHAGLLIFSVTFLLTDIVNERFGRGVTQRMIFIAFIAQIALTFFLWLGTHIEADPLWSEQGKRWDMLFVFVPQLTIASWIAFLASEHLDAYLFSWMKQKTGDRHLWLRNVVSTFPALLLDSLLFVPIAFFGAAPVGLLFAAIKAQVAIKWVVAITNIPFMYLNHAILTYDKDACAKGENEQTTGE